MTDFSSDFPPLEDFPTSSNTNENANLESDFLAREQAVLGADAALFSNSNHTITSTSNELEGFPDITSPSTSNVLSPPVSNTSIVNSVSDYSAFHSEFPPVEVESQASLVGILLLVYVNQLVYIIYIFFLQALYSNSNGKVPLSLSSDNNIIHNAEEEDPEIIRYI